DKATTAESRTRRAECPPSSLVRFVQSKSRGQLAQSWTRRRAFSVSSSNSDRAPLAVGSRQHASRRSASKLVTSPRGYKKQRVLEREYSVSQTTCPICTDRDSWEH